MLLLLLVARPLHAVPEFLEPERAFAVSVRALDGATVELRFEVARGYYLYRNSLRFGAPEVSLGEPEIPAGTLKFDDTFQRQVETHRGELRVRLPVRSAPPEFKLELSSQGCADAGLCYPPLTRVATVSLSAFGGNGTASFPDASASPTQPLPALAASLDDTVSPPHLLHSGYFWVIVGAFAVVGVLLSMTPSVLSLMPALSSIIVGAGAQPSRGRGLWLAAWYALGMAVVYSALGVAAGLVGEGLAARLQYPLQLVAVAAVLVGLALSMLGLVPIRVPGTWPARMRSTAQRMPAGQWAGAFTMGGASALRLTPRVMAPLAGTLVFVGLTGNAVLGGAAMFAVAAGMSLPLLLLGASAGAWLARAGLWMRSVQRCFGVVLLGIAISTLHPLLPGSLQMLLWGALLLLCAIGMWSPAGLQSTSGHELWRQRCSRGVALLAALLAGVQWLGAATGGTDPARPWAHLGRAAKFAQTIPAFQRVHSLAELETLLRVTDRPVVLDFYADWCISCKEVQRYTFNQPHVSHRLAGALLLTADVTDNSAADRELLRRFRLLGPPGIVFFDRHGQELSGVRVLGFQDAKRFGQSLSAAGM